MDGEKGKSKMAEYIKKSNNLCVVGASLNYLPAINALFNSIDHWNIDTDVVLLSHNLPEEYIKKAKETFDFQINVIDVSGGDQVRMTAIERFKYAVEYGKQYDAICLLDADFFFCSNVDLYFQIASKGFIITSKNGMVVNFNLEHQSKYNVFLDSPEYPYLKVHATAPIWLGPQDLDWFDTLYNSNRIDSWDDLWFLNILGIKMGKDKRMITLEPFATTNLHHFCLKPTTRIMRKDDLIIGGTEGGIDCLHGKFWDEGYYKDLATTMERFFKDEELGERQRWQMLESREIMLDEFIKYTYKCKLCLSDFIKIEWLDNKMKEKSF